MFSLPAGTLISGLACSHKERASQVLITQLQLFFSESESILCNHNTILYFNNTAGFFSPPSPSVQQDMDDISDIDDDEDAEGHDEL